MPRVCCSISSTHSLLGWGDVDFTDCTALSLDLMVLCASSICFEMSLLASTSMGTISSGTRTARIQKWYLPIAATTGWTFSGSCMMPSSFLRSVVVVVTRAAAAKRP